MAINSPCGFILGVTKAKSLHGHEPKHRARPEPRARPEARLDGRNGNASRLLPLHKVKQSLAQHLSIAPSPEYDRTRIQCGSRASTDNRLRRARNVETNNGLAAKKTNTV